MKWDCKIGAVVFFATNCLASIPFSAIAQSQTEIHWKFQELIPSFHILESGEFGYDSLWIPTQLEFDIPGSTNQRDFDITAKDGKIFGQKEFDCQPTGQPSRWIIEGTYNEDRYDFVIVDDCSGCDPAPCEYRQPWTIRAKGQLKGNKIEGTTQGSVTVFWPFKSMDPPSRNVTQVWTWNGTFTVTVTLPSEQIVDPPIEPWVCPDDDPDNGNYWICNYFPLDPGNQWQYTTGEYHVENDIRRCSSGYYGILYATQTYEFSSYVQNGKNGFVFAGCQYDQGVLEDIGEKIVLIPPVMKVGNSVRSEFPKTTLEVTLTGIEKVTVPAGTFDTLKIEIRVIDQCSYKTTLWLAKEIGPVKIHRTNPDPTDCIGCVFICVGNNDPVMLNTPAELILFHVNPNARFADIPLGYWAYDYILEIYYANFTTGCSQDPLMYCPDSYVTREQMAKFIVIALNQVPEDGYCGAINPFSDVGIDRWSCKYIKKLAELGITTGYGDGRFGPEDGVTREQMAVFLTKALDSVPLDGYCGATDPFMDMPYSWWSCKYVKRLVDLGITVGIGEGLYGPGNPVTRAQMAVFLSRAFLGM